MRRLLRPPHPTDSNWEDLEMSADWVVILTGATCWALGVVLGWMLSQRRVWQLLRRLRTQQAMIDGMHNLQADLVNELRKIANPSQD
jgi:hypothetical protein